MRAAEKSLQHAAKVTEYWDSKLWEPQPFFKTEEDASAFFEARAVKIKHAQDVFVSFIEKVSDLEDDLAAKQRAVRRLTSQMHAFKKAWLKRWENGVASISKAPYSIIL